MVIIFKILRRYLLSIFLVTSYKDKHKLAFLIENSVFLICNKANNCTRMQIDITEIHWIMDDNDMTNGYMMTQDNIPDSLDFPTLTLSSVLYSL